MNASRFILIALVLSALVVVGTGRTHSVVESSEALYGDVKVWSTSPMQEAALAELAKALETNDLDAYPPERWGSREAVRLAERMSNLFAAGEFIIDLPLGQSSVPDGTLPTQLRLLAFVYAQVDDPRFKEAFVQGLQTLLDAQFPSGGWPTIYPRYKDQDLYPDVYAKTATWSSIPELMEEILQGRFPFDTGIAESIDPASLKEALSRIPPAGSIKGFLYSDYSGKSPAWWRSEEAIRIGDNLISWQTPHGGWWVDTAMHVLPYSPERMRRGPSTGGVERGSLDDHATTDQIRFMAMLYEATELERFKESFYRGLEFLLTAQYPTGGWPQSYPNASGYGGHVTFNDNAMGNVLSLLQEIYLERFPFQFVDDEYVARLKDAFEQGIEYILNAQIEVDGRLTAWAQQHDPVTHEPRTARVFEPIAITGNESVGVVQLLQTIPEPSREVRRAILSALEWFETAQLSDGRWARFYEIGTNRPIFVGRDGIVRYDLREIDEERQKNYAWYGTWPESVLSQAKVSGTMDDLYESLPDHPSVRVKILSPSGRLNGVVPVDVVLLHPHKAAELTSVRIDVDGEIVYNGTSVPEPGEVQIDTTQLDDGRRTITVTTVHREYGTFHHSVLFNVSNTWRLTQNMTPPVTQGWFGRVDYLRTERRSEGWGYATGENARFFGDSQRLVRKTDATEYLVWETPTLRRVEVTVFTLPDIVVEQGLELAVSTNGDDWHVVAYEGEGEEGPSEWRRLVITGGFSEDVKWNWFRLTLTEAIPEDALQIGRVYFEGMR